MNIGFTGTQNGMTFSQRTVLRELLRGIFREEPSIKHSFHHGDCVGADAEACEIAKNLGFWRVSHPPTNPNKRAFCEYDEIHMPKPYLERNRDIVDASERLYATPFEFNNKLRSGTWYTYRYATDAMKFRVLIFRDGTISTQGPKI